MRAKRNWVLLTMQRRGSGGYGEEKGYGSLWGSWRPWGTPGNYMMYRLRSFPLESRDQMKGKGPFQLCTCNIIQL